MRKGPTFLSGLVTIMLKSLGRTFKGALIASLLLQIGSPAAWSQGRKVVTSSKKVPASKAPLNAISAKQIPSSKMSTGRLTSRNSSKLNFKPNVSRTFRVAHYKRAETLSQTATMSVNDRTEEKIVTGSVAIAHSQSMIDHRDGSRQEARSLIMSVNTKLNEEWNVMTRVSYQDNPREVDSITNGFSDLSFSLGKKSSELADWLKGSYSFSAVLPTSKYSKDYQNLQTSIGANYRFSLTPVVLAKGFDFSLSVGASRNFHQYETDKSGRVLNEYSIRETVSGSYSYKDFTFSADLMFRHGFSYNGEVSQAFEHSQEIGYSITPRWGVSLGHTNSGSWFRPNGQDSNLKLIDENDSIIYGSTSLTF